jgi:hypothetical protein
MSHFTYYVKDMLQNTLGTKKLQIYGQNGSHKKTF